MNLSTGILLLNVLCFPLKITQKRFKLFVAVMVINAQITNQTIWLNFRVNTALPAVTYYKTGDISDVPFSCVVLDLSLGGALVAYPRGSEIKDTSIGEMPNFSLSFELPRSKEEVRFRCDLRRVFNIDNGVKIGAAFIDSNENHLERLGTYLA